MKSSVTIFAAAALAAALGMSAVHAQVPAAVQPSFDCAKSQGTVEKLICGNGALAMLDRESTRLFDLARAGPDHGKVVASQNAWLKRRDDCASSTDKERCVSESYVKRIAALLHDYPLTRTSKNGLSIGPFTATCQGYGKPVQVTFVNSTPSFVHITSGDVSVVLKQALSADGARYEAQFPKGQARLWNKGDTAQIAFPGGKDMNCTLKPAAN